MKPTSENRIWLFSFADLAFLLLIAFTQASTIGKVPVSVGEMTLPKVVDSPQVAAFPKQAQMYQIRIHKPAPDTAGPFQIIAVDNRQEVYEGRRLTTTDLSEQLSELHQTGVRRPVLIPDEKSLSKDMLMAMSLVEKTWTTARTVTVEKVKNLDRK